MSDSTSSATERKAGVPRDDIEAPIARQFGDEVLGDAVRAKLRYYPTVTREAFHNQGRLTDLIATERLAAAVGLPPLDPREDRFMLCGSPAMLAESRQLLDERGFEIAPRIGHPGDYVIERAFTEK